MSDESTVRDVWNRQSVWSQAANRMKASIGLISAALPFIVDW
jgi:hypothetical protein